MIELFYFIFCLLYLFSLFYVIFKKRSVDFFTLMVFSLSYYSFPLLLEELTLVCVIENIPIHENIYLIFIFIYTVNFIFMIKTDYKDLNKIYVINHSQSIENNLLLILTILLFIIGVYFTGFSEYFFGTKKDDVDLNVFIGLSIWSSLALFIVSYHANKKNKINILISLIIILSVLFFGYRSYTVVLFLIFSLLFLNFQKIRLYKKFHYFMLGFILVLFLTIFKLLYGTLKYADISTLISIVRNVDFSTYYMLFFVDPLAVTYNLNLVILNETSLPVSYFFHRLISILPFYSGFYSEITNYEYLKLSDILHENYHTVNLGLASSFLGELLALINYIGFFVGIIIWIFSIYIFNKKIKDINTLFIKMLVPMIVYMTFYIHRVDITFILGSFKMLLIVWLCVTLSSVILKKISSRRKNEYSISM